MCEVLTRATFLFYNRNFCLKGEYSKRRRRNDWVPALEERIAQKTWRSAEAAEVLMWIKH
jgi:hypothetical protein